MKVENIKISSTLTIEKSDYVNICRVCEYMQKKTCMLEILVVKSF